MRYYCTRDRIEIRSENAALPWSQTSAKAIKYLDNLPHVKNCADVGCGKGRYLNAIHRRCDHLTIIDSTHQLSRIQKIGSRNSNLINLYGSVNSISVRNKCALNDNMQQFDRIFIWNVFPIVPFPAVRDNLLKKASMRLSDGGAIEVAINYRNSEFNKALKSEN